VAIVTLFFDVLIPVGVFAALGHFLGAEVDTLFIVALLTILGISINDKIVVFDRIRENLHLGAGKNQNFADVVSHSIRQTLARSINTSLTVVIMLLCLYFLGPTTTQVFALTLTVGMVVGTYSSIFFAAPLLVVWQKWQAKS
jgi:preprotein translocase subunit SecF